MEFNGKTVCHRDINATYTLLVAGVENYSTDAERVMYQAYAVGQQTHRLWTIPQDTETVRGMLKTGLLIDPME
jgi:hypothetical protein